MGDAAVRLLLSAPESPGDQGAVDLPRVDLATTLVVRASTAPLGGVGA
jgi:hypothetical protein